MNLGRVGGILEAKKIAGMAEAHYAQNRAASLLRPDRRRGQHSARRCSPNFLILESIEPTGRLPTANPQKADPMGRWLCHPAGRAGARRRAERGGGAGPSLDGDGSASHAPDRRRRCHRIEVFCDHASPLAPRPKDFQVIQREADNVASPSSKLSSAQSWTNRVVGAIGGVDPGVRRRWHGNQLLPSRPQLGIPNAIRQESKRTPRRFCPCSRAWTS